MTLRFIGIPASCRIRNWDWSGSNLVNAGPARWNNTAFRDNLAFLPDQDYELLVEEVREFHGAGGSCIVDLSNQGIGPFPEATKRLATELEMHVVLGCGFYIHDSHPDWLENASVNDLEDALATELREGILQSGVRPGIIGEIGTSEQLHPCEERVLRAAARVAHRTGTAINVHAHPPDLAVVMRIIDILVGEQEVDADRIYISHLDEIVDVDYHARVLERGVVVGFDSFGQDGYYTPTWKSRSDLEKMTTLAKMVEFGFAAQLVVAQDLGRKHYLRANGGMGFDHVIQPGAATPPDQFWDRRVRHPGASGQDATATLDPDPGPGDYRPPHRADGYRRGPCHEGSTRRRRRLIHIYNADWVTRRAESSVGGKRWGVSTARCASSRAGHRGSERPLPSALSRKAPQ